MEEKIERCIECDEATGNAGLGEGSLYAEDESGPYCGECMSVYGGDECED